MILRFEEIKKITVGAPYMENTDEGMRFYKYNPNLFSVWTNHRKVFGQRVRSTTGIRLDFHTNSRRMDLEIAERSRFEIYIDGLFRYSMRDTEKLSVDIYTSLDQPLDDVRITIYFPSHDEGIIKSLELDDGAYVKPHKFDKKILFMGDSITQGWASEFDSLSYANRLSRYFNADSVIQGVGGACFYDDCLEKLPFEPDWVIVAYGTNDFKTYNSLEDFNIHLRAYMSKLSVLYGDKKVFVISPIWREDRTPKDRLTFEECRHAIISEAQENGFIHLDGSCLVPHDLSFYTDGLHPNDTGFYVYANNLIKALDKELNT